MSDKNFPDVIREIHEQDNRYGKGAYYFIREALDHTLKSMQKNKQGEGGHVSGIQLLEGIRDYALDKFGPMTLTMMDHWNIQKCRDFWEIVFNLVDLVSLGELKMIRWKISNRDTTLYRHSGILFFRANGKHRP